MEPKFWYPIETGFCNQNVTNHYIRHLDFAIGCESCNNTIVIKQDELLVLHLGFDIMKKFPPGDFSNVTAKLEFLKQKFNGKWDDTGICKVNK